MRKQPTFRTGEPITESGIYRVIHEAHRLPHEVTLLKDQVFPRCAKCRNEVKFELVRAVSERLNHQDFRIYLYELDEEGVTSGHLSDKEIAQVFRARGECRAGDLVGYSLVPDDQCNTLCTADRSERCGGALRNSIYAVPVPANRVNGSLQTGFLYDGARIVAQIDGSNQMVSQFIYATGPGAPDYMVRAGVTYRIFSNQLGSPRLVVNTATGAIAQRMDYDAFGNVIVDTNPGFQPFGFAGGLYDQDTKLVRFGARDYNPAVGRWTAKDPLRFAGGDTNLYGYVLNDPVNMTDSSGLEGKVCGTCEKKSSPQQPQPASTDGNGTTPAEPAKHVIRDAVVEFIGHLLERSGSEAVGPAVGPGDDCPRC